MTTNLFPGKLKETGGEALRSMLLDQKGKSGKSKSNSISPQILCPDAAETKKAKPYFGTPLEELVAIEGMRRRERSRGGARQRENKGRTQSTENEGEGEGGR
jgi:hypothetical protein